MEAGVDLSLRRALAIRLGVRAPLFLLAIGAILFLPARTFRYWEAWGFIATALTCVIPFTIWLLIHDPELLERRMRTREKEREQKWLVAGAAIYSVAAYTIPGFDHRFGWSDVPAAAVIAADVMFIAAYALFILVLRENRYASRVVEVTEGQTVIATGPYAVVRHPMYLGSIVLNLTSAVALGSWWALLAMLPMVWVFVRRIRNEEGVLLRDLPGYGDYMKRVGYRLVPGVW